MISASATGSLVSIAGCSLQMPEVDMIAWLPEYIKANAPGAETQCNSERINQQPVCNGHGTVAVPWAVPVRCVSRALRHLQNVKHLHSSRRVLVCSNTQQSGPLAPACCPPGRGPLPRYLWTYGSCSTSSFDLKPNRDPHATVALWVLRYS